MTIKCGMTTLSSDTSNPCHGRLTCHPLWTLPVSHVSRCKSWNYNICWPLLQSFSLALFYLIIIYLLHNLYYSLAINKTYAKHICANCDMWNLKYVLECIKKPQDPPLPTSMWGYNDICMSCLEFVITNNLQNNWLVFVLVSIWTL